MGHPSRSLNLAAAGKGVLYAGVLVAVAVVFGAVSAVYGNLFQDKPNFLLALPLALALLICFVVSRPVLLMLILFVRAPLDPLMEATRMNVGPIPLGLGGLMNALILLLVASLVFDKLKPAWREGLRMWGPFIALCALGAAMAPDKGGAVRLLLALLTFPAAFLAGTRGLPERGRFDSAACFILSSVLLVNVYVLGGIASGEAFYKVFVDSEDAGTRLSGPFPHANILAFYLVMALALCVYVLHERKRMKVPLATPLAWTVLLTALPLLVLTKTRAAWAATYLMFVLYAVFANRKVLPLLIIGPLLALALPDVRDRLTSLGSTQADVTLYAKLDSYAWRELMWTSALSWMNKPHWLAGYGLNSFLTYSPIFFPLSGKAAFGAHNVYVQIFFELGVLGLGAWLWLMGSLLVGFWRMPRVAARNLLLFLVLMYMVVSYSDNMLHYLVFNVYLFYVLGAGWALRRAVPATATAAAAPQATTRPGRGPATPRAPAAHTAPPRPVRHAPAWDVTFLPQAPGRRP